MQTLSRRAALALLVAAATAPRAARAWPSSQNLDAFVTRQMARARVPGLAAAVVRGGRVAWARGFGHADLARRVPVTADTLFLTASVSKPVTAAALLQLCDEGRVGLDDDVSRHLPFPVRHPRFPRAAITPRMLLTHTAGIADSDAPDDLVVPGDSPVALADFAREYLTPGGRWYDAGDNFTRRAPGAAYEYCNVGVTLAGYLVEAVAREPFEARCRRALFAPLGMRASGWRLAHVDPARVAVPYAWRRGRYVPRAHYGFPDIPDGALRASAPEYARFLLALLGRGALGGARVLREATVDEMFRVQNARVAPGQRLAWYRDDDAPDGVLCQNGAYLGASADAWLDPRRGLGLVVLANGQTYMDERDSEVEALVALVARLWALAPTL